MLGSLKAEIITWHNVQILLFLMTYVWYDKESLVRSWKT
jgi:hypothetical protein